MVLGERVRARKLKRDNRLDDEPMHRSSWSVLSRSLEPQDLAMQPPGLLRNVLAPKHTLNRPSGAFRRLHGLWVSLHHNVD